MRGSVVKAEDSSVRADAGSVTRWLQNKIEATAIRPQAPDRARLAGYSPPAVDFLACFACAYSLPAAPRRIGVLCSGLLTLCFQGLQMPSHPATESRFRRSISLQSTELDFT